MRSSALGLPAALLIVACSADAPAARSDASPDGPSPTGFPVTVVDAAGVQHTFQRPPSAIISLIPSATETLLALGASFALVARTDFDTLAALAHLPSVGGGINPSIEAVLVREPDLVITFQGPNSAALDERLTDLGVQSLPLRPDGIEDARAIVGLLGRLTDRSAAADSLLEAIDATLARVAAAVEGRPPVRVAFLLGGRAPYAAGPDTYVDELITLAGGENVYADLQQLYAQVSVESLLLRDIDLIVMPEGAEPVPGVDHPVRLVSPSVQLPGPRLGEAALSLARALHPEAFR